MKKIRIRTFIARCFAALVVPLLVVVIALFGYTLQRNAKEFTGHLEDLASTAASSVEDQLKVSQDILQKASISMEFLHFGYAQKTDRLYAYATDLTQDYLAAPFSSVSISRGFLLYNSNTDYVYTNYNGVSPGFYQAVMELLDDEAQREGEGELFFLFPQGGPGCALMISCQQAGVLVAVMDLSQDLVMQVTSRDFEGGLLFGQPGEYDPARYKEVPVGEYPLSLFYQKPRVSLFDWVDSTQVALLVITVVLILLMPLVLLVFYTRFYKPLLEMAHGFSIVSQGDLSYRISQERKNNLEELEVFRSGFNKMMDAVEEERATALKWQQESYRQRLDVMQAQLQYLQLQARPHFYLNCLKNVDSLLTLGRPEDAHQLLMALSGYLRHSFRDIRSFLSLREELTAVNQYVELCQHLSQGISLFLNLDNDCLACKVLPMSILTFVENCIKHSPGDVEISITVAGKELPEGKVLAISIENDGGPFEPQILEALNSADPSDIQYHNQHVGISNVRYRLWLVFKERAKLSFRNEGRNAIVEIHLPYEQEEEDL